MNESGLFGSLFSLIGLLSQAVVTLLLLLFFLLFKRHVGRQAHYFVYWSWAWLALAVCLLSLAAGFTGLPYVINPADSTPGWWFPAAFFIYQLAKFAYLLLLLAGVMEYVHGSLPRDFFQRGTAFISICALLSFVFSYDIDAILLWQVLMFLLVCAYSAMRMLRLPPARRTIGVYMTAGTLMGTALLWLIYAAAFYLHLVSGLSVFKVFVSSVTHFNSYYDAFLEMLLAFGMLLIVLEETRRETDAAHAELAVAHQQLINESMIDTLTGAYNRLAFTRDAVPDSAGSSGTVLLFDLDNLKQVNDAHGHEAGDELLRHFAATVRAVLRSGDQLYRWGGDEFLLLMPSAGLASVGPRLSETLQRAAPLRFTQAGVAVSLQVSMGGAEYASAVSVRAAVQVADRAMYQDKRRRKHGIGAEPRVPGVDSAPS